MLVSFEETFAFKGLLSWKRIGFLQLEQIFSALKRRIERRTTATL